MQSLVYSFSQPDYIRAAHSGLYAATMSLKDEKQQVALDVSVAYVELNHDLEEIAALNDEQTYAEKLVSIEGERVGNGVDPRVSELQAQLTGAQVAEKLVHLQNDADEMRQKLAHLTGLPLESLQTNAASIPPAPNFSAQLPSDQQLAEANGGIAAAYANAQSKSYVAHGDKRQIDRPSLGFGLKYQRFAKYEDFAEYYHNFQQNNVSAGVQLSIPLFDRSLKAKARESAAVAAGAKADADASLDTLSEQNLAARRSIQELAAEQRVAQLKSELAQEELKTVDTELTSGPGSPNAQPVSPITAQQAHIQERERYEDLLDTNFSLIKVQLNLLRLTGQIDDWARSSAK
jgi:outer membrane protein TolC